MAYYKLERVLTDLARSLKRTERLAACAERWAGAPHRCIPKFSAWHQVTVTELAFLQAFLAWEAFLEESFILHLLGKRPPKGRAPVRYVTPPNRSAAETLVIPLGRRYASWTTTGTVIARAEQFFRRGDPYASALRGSQYALDEMQTIRNAIVHSSTHSQRQFQGLTRGRLGTYQRGLKVGEFLSMPVPGCSPPESFLEQYLDRLRFVADTIVPT